VHHAAHARCCPPHLLHLLLPLPPRHLLVHLPPQHLILLQLLPLQARCGQLRLCDLDVLTRLWGEGEVRGRGGCEVVGLWGCGVVR
jgi:hypothetical protein